jgi:putative transposase
MYRRNYLSLFVHLVWGTWDRQPLLSGPLEQQVYRAIGAKCVELDAEVVALGGIEDHVHLLVSLPSTLAIANLVGQVKGASSHLVNQEGLPTAGGAVFKWQGTYGAFTVSQPLVRDVSTYILHQREHHSRGTLLAEWEGAPTLDPPGPEGRAQPQGRV